MAKIKVPAYKWENSIMIDVHEIKSVRKSRLISSYNNQERVWGGLTDTPCNVAVYETRNRFHYIAKVGHGFNCFDDVVIYCYSSSKECNESVVASYIAGVLDGTYDAKE